MLSIGAAFLCDTVIAVDCDNDALNLACNNAKIVDLDDCIEFIQAKVNMKSQPKQSSNSRKQRSGGKRGGRGGRGSQSSIQTKSLIIMDHTDGIPLKDCCVDTVLTNPPFGTKMNAGIDVQFLRTATRLAKRAVYSFHKRSTRAFLMRIVREWGFEIEVAAEMEFDIPQMYNFHKQKNKDIEVDLLRVIIVAGDKEIQRE